MAFRARRVMRRRAIVRTAAVGGAAYYAGKRREQGTQHEADQDAQLAEMQPQSYAQEATPPPAPPPPAPAAAPTMDDKIEQIKQLAQLHTDGVLTDEEFAAQKQQILG
jgi:putative oligomerization/nucleic acid binding protein